MNTTVYNGKKWCNKCRSTRRVKFFQKRSKQKPNSRYVAWCRDCNREYQKQWARKDLKENPERHTIVQRRHRGCINPSGERRKGKCDICERVGKLDYDHNHITGKFRGWLCRGCNPKIEWHIKYFQRIQKYLEKRHA